MKKVLIFILSLIMLFSSSIVVSAASNFEEYIYDTMGESVKAPQTYKPVSVLYGNEETEKIFSSPKDIDVDENGKLYLLDSGNNRIVLYNSDIKLEKEIAAPIISGEKISFETCTGIFVDDEEIYVCDKEKGNIYVLKKDGSSNRIITFSPLPVVEDDFIFKPVRLISDENGILQVQAEGCFNGLITMDAEGNMIGYYSANTIQASLSVIAAQFWRKIFSDEQQNSIKQIVPVEYSSLTVDKDGFIYTTTSNTENSTFEIKKLNPYGDNILGYDDSDVKIGNGDYGDLRTFREAGLDVDTTFGDVYVDDDGFIFALDTTRGRIFQYDQSSALISVFGGLGNQTGTFAIPTAVSGYNGNIYVLDSTKNSLTVFEPNEYVNNIRKAILLDNDCDYENAVKYWEKVYEENTNYSLALSGLGKAAYEQGDLKSAMSYFEKANDRTNYDIVFNVYRTQFIRDNFLWFGLGLLLIAVGTPIVIRLIRRKKYES